MLEVCLGHAQPCGVSNRVFLTFFNLPGCDGCGGCDGCDGSDGSDGSSPWYISLIASTCDSFDSRLITQIRGYTTPINGRMGDSLKIASF